MNNDHRPRLVAGLRALADFLEANPEIPAPRNVTVHHFPKRANDAEICAEVDAIAARLGSEIDPQEREHGHYSASINFGPVSYKAVAIVAATRARHEAESSYVGCVQPDAPTIDPAHAA
ncbi:hypothetical protein IMZ11_33395 [Microtetraspora sp. AC03309]|uniref:hypothetical protein n=1 Tax=Microtetraspora sp. AC03309 TaxID=2779376 RepID=UPI001E3A5878|nr:hypothetical protein [Microtetraspora sp. AC03309]MCC5580525.1 hypothetical protein [Microtetraspora sp. AC03309]